MKKFTVLALVCCCITAFPVFCAAQRETKIQNTPDMFGVYIDNGSSENHYAPSGWMGDYGDIKLNNQSKDKSHSGKSCIQVIYTAKKSQGKGWAGVYWQSPANNWGSKKGGFDLTGMTKLTFWAKGQTGGEIIQKFLVGGIKGDYPDSARVEIGPVELTDTWRQYTINLAAKDLSYISGGFCWVTTSDLNPNGATFYIDDIKFELDPAMKPEPRKKERMPFYVYEDSRSINNHFVPSGWMGDYDDIKLETNSNDYPYLGATCIKITYAAKATQGARWTGMYWQNPADNWGTMPEGGFDLSRATRISFWARGEKGREIIEEFKVGGIAGEHPDSDSASIGPIVLNKDWTEYTIDLKGKDLSYISGGFCWATNMDVNPTGVVFYLDEIKYE